MRSIRDEIILLLCVAVLRIAPVESTGSSITSSQVRELRDRFLAEAKTLPPSTYDPEDVNDVRQTATENGTDWPVRRYLDWCDGSLSDAISLMRDNFRYRQAVGLNRLTPQDFPCEFFDTGMIQLSRDRSNRSMLVFNWLINGPFGTMRTEWYKFFYYNMNLVDKAVGERGWSILSWLSDGLRPDNVDFTGVIRLVPLGDRFPGGPRQIVGSEMSPFITPIVNIIVGLVPERLSKIIFFPKGRGIFKYLRKRDLPVTLGGKAGLQRGIPLIPRPLDCGNLTRLARRHGWTEADVQYFLDYTKGPREELLNKFFNS